MISVAALALRRYRLFDPETGQKRTTQAALAARLGCSQAMINQLEAGTKQPSVRLATRIEALGVCMAADWARPAPRDAIDGLAA